MYALVIQLLPVQPNAPLPGWYLWQPDAGAGVRVWPTLDEARAAAADFDPARVAWRVVLLPGIG